VTGDPGAPVAASVNGEPCDLADGTTVAALVERWCPSPRGVAVAVDGEVVPRSTWAATTIPAGAAVEIVSAAAGG
jgi:sulfur carrier protein